MKNKLIEHIAGIAFVTVLIVILMFVFSAMRKNEETYAGSRVKEFLDIKIQNPDDRFQRALLKDAMNIFYPDRAELNDTLVSEILTIKGDQFNKRIQSTNTKKSLSASVFLELTGLYLKFLFIYIVVMILTYYGVQTLGTWRFVREKHKEHLSIHNPELYHKNRFSFATIAFNLLKTFAYLILFSPAYVIAYSIRTEFNTDSIFFMIFLGVISNGLLMMYTNKFHAFLVSESRKGYVDTARVKNLNEEFTISHQGIPLTSLLHPFKKFKGHLFEHIFRNAHFQYLSTIKEQASFLITGLVIIEMALNIQGHFNYELLRQLLFQNYSIVLVIVAMIFYTVKFTEIVTDYLIHREIKRYENR
ncbi:MAG: hypothetical protein ACM31E_05490 [Fibrobacterota bacterium]|nr:hypothetical protein [Chitinispirillaceae bacterium]